MPRHAHPHPRSGRRSAGVALAVVALTAACATADEAAGSRADASADAVASTNAAVEPEQASSSDPTATSDDPATDGVATSAAGSGIATYDGDRYEFDVVGCGWVSGTSTDDLPFSADPGDQQLFQLVGVGGEGDAEFFVGLSWNGEVGNVEATAGHTGEPGFLASGGLNPTSSLDIDGDRVATVRPLAVREGGAQASPLEVEATCDRFGGSFGAMEQILQEATGRQVTSPEERGGTGTLTLDDGQTLDVRVDSCEDKGVTMAVQATAPDGTWLYLMAAESGSDEVVVGREDDRTGDDARGDLIVRDGDRLRSDGPVELSDRIDDTPAGTVVFDVTCG